LRAFDARQAEGGAEIVDDLQAGKGARVVGAVLAAGQFE
jgi:hypothetical protein